MGHLVGGAQGVAAGAATGLARELQIRGVGGVDPVQRLPGACRVTQLAQQVDARAGYLGRAGKPRDAGDLQVVDADHHAIAIGAQPADGSDPNVLEDKKDSKAPADPAERSPLILAAVEKIVAGNERKDFTAAGSPTVKAVERELGFDVDAREIAAVWQEYHEKKAAQ